MPRWILICRNCKTEFQHSQISDVGLASLLQPEKPIPSSGNICVCPNCGHAAAYQRTDLFYRD